MSVLSLVVKNKPNISFHGSVLSAAPWFNVSIYRRYDGKLVPTIMPDFE
jgi:hypothetical protein